MEGKVIGPDFRNILQNPPIPNAHLSIHLILGQRALESVTVIVSNLTQKQKNMIRRKKLALFLVANNDGEISRSVQVSAGSKQKYFSALGSDIETTVICSSESKEKFRDLINGAAERQDVAAIIVQMPIPIDYDDILKDIPITKDIDALNPSNPELCATAFGIWRIIDSFYIPGKDTILVNGYRGFVGRQVAKHLTRQNIQWIGHEIDSTDSLEKKMNQASIFVTTVGKPNLIPIHYFNGQKLVIDTGYSFTKDGMISGDVDSALYLTDGHITHITPVPCGCGPLEMAILLERFIGICLEKNITPPKPNYCSCIMSNTEL